jgi:hypothetical protein
VNHHLGHGFFFICLLTPRVRIICTQGILLLSTSMAWDAGFCDSRTDARDAQSLE